MTRDTHDLSIKTIIITTFVLVIMIAVAVIAYLIFSRWYSSAESTVMKISHSINNHIYEQVASFMESPVSINNENHKLIRDGIVDIQNEEERERYFLGALDSFNEEIYSYSYGTAEGAYYGARRNETGDLEIMRNDHSTGGNSWYFSVDDDYRAGDIAVKLGQFDPRTRPWFQAAVEAGAPAFSPLYKHFVMDDLTVSVATPVYSSEGVLKGVLGTHMLLSKIGSFLEKTVTPYEGMALIVERESGYVIANSQGLQNFTIRPDRSLERLHIEQITNEALYNAFEQFTSTGKSQLTYRQGIEHMFADIQGFKAEGVDWVIISAVTGGFLLDEVQESISLTILLIIITILVIVLIYQLITSRLFRPIRELLDVSKAIAEGDLSRRVTVARDDEIGSIASSLNHVANSLQQLFFNLENSVEKRTHELHETNTQLEANRDQLSLILNSAAEGIYGIDSEGNCTFCNRSSLLLLGYEREEDLLGKNMHDLIHHSYEDGSKFPLDSCKVFRAIQTGIGYSENGEVFWKKNGSNFPVSYHAFPQIRNEQVIGAVITFTDITERRQHEQQIEYMRCHDSLTGLHNRNCFEEKHTTLDVPENLPLSIIFADINALKLTNDIFGHSAGDELIKKSAEILKHVCRDSGIIARLGGDEFIIVLPNTTTDDAARIIGQIQLEFSQTKVEAMRCSISLGSCTKAHQEQSLSDTIVTAENQMYQDKTRNRGTVNRAIISALQETLHTRSPREKDHAEKVKDIASRFGSSLHLNEAEISALERTAYLHDIGKIVLEPHILDSEQLRDDEREQIRQHPAIGYRILNLFDDTLDIAEYVYGHHERWDGSGYPRGLKHDQIPYISRILSIAEAYERIVERSHSREEAFKEIQEGKGTQFDPELAQAFLDMMEQQ